MPLIEDTLQSECAEFGLCGGVSAVGGATQPAKGFADAGRHAKTHQVAVTEAILCLAQARARCLSEQWEGRCMQFLIGECLGQREARGWDADDGQQAVQPGLGREHGGILHAQG